jgi:hypothetical protein
MDLLRVLTASSDDRALLIQALFDRATTRELAEVLMDLEANPLHRVQVADMLNQLRRAEGGTIGPWRPS